MQEAQESVGLIPWSGRSPVEGNRNPFQDSFFETQRDEDSYVKAQDGVTDKVGTGEAPGLALAQRQAQGKGLCATVGVPPDSTLTTNTGSRAPEGLFIAGETPQPKQCCSSGQAPATAQTPGSSGKEGSGALGLRTVLGWHNTMKIQS